MIALAFTVSSQRPKYLREALESWVKVRGIRDASLVFSLEPPPEAFGLDWFREWVTATFGSARVHVNRERLGCLGNTRHAMDLAFGTGASFAVLAEEDVTVADDILEYFAWARDRYAPDEAVKAVCAHSKAVRGGAPSQVTRSTWFNPIGWGTWPDRWRQYIRPNWQAGPDVKHNQAWDNHLRARLQEDYFYSVFPLRSRTLHRGQVSTLTAPPLSEHFYRSSVSETFAPVYGPQEYEEIPFPQDAGLLV